MGYADFRRTLVNPHWCEGNPLDWKAKDAEAIGIAHLAQESKVGMFNLAWWLLHCKTPPQASHVYRATPLAWAILAAPRLVVGHMSLADHAALKTRQQFEQFLFSKASYLGARVERQGVTWDRLRGLCLNKVS